MGSSELPVELESMVEHMDIDNPTETTGESMRLRKDRLVLTPVLGAASGKGLPYAPENWPRRGDIWEWRVGTRVTASGHYVDRYLYLPKRLRGRGSESVKKQPFRSLPMVKNYFTAAFPDEDFKAFFDSFAWKIPAVTIPMKNGGRSSDSLFASPPPLPIEIPSEAGPACKSGNRNCKSLLTQETNPVAGFTPCDICCTEPRFCRDCCCILCCKFINLKEGACDYILCEAEDGDGYICGHVSHVKCALRAYMAGTVGGTIGLNAQYYCRRCDVKTDVIPHVRKILQTCESSDSRDDMEKFLVLGVCLLRNSQKANAKELLCHLEFCITKIKGGTALEDICKTLGVWTANSSSHLTSTLEDISKAPESELGVCTTNFSYDPTDLG